MKRKREETQIDSVEAIATPCITTTDTDNNITMDIVWQTPANPPHRDDYIFHKGRRHVKPYYFEFICHVKNRWAGKTIVDMFTEEFKGRPQDYYVRAVKCGRIQVEGKNVSIYYRVKPSEKISHFVHRHEPPVMAWDVSVLKEEEDVLTVCKPASVPVHPCGQYRKNTIVGILEAEQGLAPLFPIHRLDRLVSGLLILARSSSKADTFRQQQVDANVNYDAREGRSYVEVGDGSSDIKLKGKAACTKFKRIKTDGKYSVVLCEPITGRTHQIRVHLQYTGHPIANDMLYLDESAGRRSTAGTGVDRAAARLRDSLSWEISGNNEDSEEESVNNFSKDPMCTHCPSLAPNGYDGCEEGLWLHCIKYTGPDWTYECPYPDWASLD
ncbi:RNA pseudouridine synthase 7 isoform X2 [Amaranthus tricolor]|uniref:RNA pseudouridine synthase 7 isoform X2 n=1 Tax=Amaranthus tricolor TaxID=29722 RepID=UPI0025850C3B|nr:RNA pseudouridine synthase 7 isoform X2 [Amaranthus tricolor]